jgi:small subunit ribosomal protein S2
MATKKATEKKVIVSASTKSELSTKKDVVKKVSSAKSKLVAKEIDKVEITLDAVETKETPVKVNEEVKVAKKSGEKITAEELFEAGAHFGHVVKKWNPKMRKFLWGEKNGIHIFDLEKTLLGLEEACKVLSQAAEDGKRIVMVGTKRQAKQMLEAEAKRVGVSYITQRWMGGLITNWKQVKQTMDRLNSLKLKRDQGDLKKFTKKEQVLIDKEIVRLERIVGGIATLKNAPELIVAIDTHKEKLAVKESNNRKVPVIGLVDSNANPDVVDYPIPMNDDSAKALQIVISAFGSAIESGMKKKKDTVVASK